MPEHPRSTSRTPLVSVCVPTYNGAEFLKACLDSLLAQELQDYEVLIGDDGSTDGTLQIARGYTDPRFRILPFESRVGMAGNWNRCLAEARGKYVALVAQDDWVTPQWAARLAGLLESHPEADLAFGRREFEFLDKHSQEAVGCFFQSKYPAMLQAFYERAGTVIPPDVMLDAAMQHRFEVNLIGEPSFTMVRRDHPATRAGYHPGMRQMIDWEFTSRFFVDRPILHCPEALGTYRIHSAGASVGNTPMTLQYKEYMLLLESVLKRFADRISVSQRAQLLQRRAKFEAELLTHAEILESAQVQLLAHTKTLQRECDGLREHASNLEKIVSKTHAEPVYRALCKLKGFFE